VECGRCIEIEAAYATRPLAGATAMSPTQARFAFQVPASVPLTAYEPDIESPETVPLYVIVVAPIVPNLIVDPVRLPVRSKVDFGFESVIEPLSTSPVCVHVRLNVPEDCPVYCPFHVPDRPVAAAEDEVGVVLVGDAELATAAEDVVGAAVMADDDGVVVDAAVVAVDARVDEDFVPPLLPHAVRTSRPANAAPAVRNEADIVSSLLRRGGSGATDAAAATGHNSSDYVPAMAA
jgi:hypothetical protein